MAIFACVFHVSFSSVTSHSPMTGKSSVSVFSLIFVFCNLISGVARSNSLNWFSSMTFASAPVSGSTSVFVPLIQIEHLFFFVFFCAVRWMFMCCTILVMSSSRESSLSELLRASCSTC